MAVVAVLVAWLMPLAAAATTVGVWVWVGVAVAVAVNDWQSAVAELA